MLTRPAITFLANRRTVLSPPLPISYPTFALGYINHFNQLTYRATGGERKRSIHLIWRIQRWLQIESRFLCRPCIAVCRSSTAIKPINTVCAVVCLGAVNFCWFLCLTSCRSPTEWHHYLITVQQRVLPKKRVLVLVSKSSGVEGTVRWLPATAPSTAMLLTCGITCTRTLAVAVGVFHAICCCQSLSACVCCYSSTLVAAFNFRCNGWGQQMIAHWSRMAL